MLIQNEASTGTHSHCSQPGAETPSRVVAKLAHDRQQLFENDLGDVFGVGWLKPPVVAPYPNARLIATDEYVPIMAVAALLRQTHEEGVRRVSIRRNHERR